MASGAYKRTFRLPTDVKKVEVPPIAVVASGRDTNHRGYTECPDGTDAERKFELFSGALVSVAYSGGGGGSRTNHYVENTSVIDSVKCHNG
jgi:hypothetical protein